MNNIGKNSFDIGYLDTLAGENSFLHRLDPRAKLITTFVFIVTVVSFDKYAFSALIPFFAYLAVLVSIGGLPVRYLLRKILVISPFALLVGIFNPFIDREIVLHIGKVGISGGWISYLSILTRFFLTVSAALILIATTGFNAVCGSLIKLGVPRPFVIQLLFFYRYIFILTDEAERMVRARSLRTFDARLMGFKVFVSLVSNLLLRTLERAERIYRAMCCRGFDGNIRLIRTMKITSKEIGFAWGWIVLFVLFRCFNMPLIFGRLISGGLP
jgi:cobalt/nickel transport system permease protein